MQIKSSNWSDQKLLNQKKMHNFQSSNHHCDYEKLLESTLKKEWDTEAVNKKRRKSRHPESPQLLNNETIISTLCWALSCSSLKSFFLPNLFAFSSLARVSHSPAIVVVIIIIIIIFYSFLCRRILHTHKSFSSPFIALLRHLFHSRYAMLHATQKGVKNAIKTEFFNSSECIS